MQVLFGEFMQIVLASQNQHKIEEINAMLPQDVSIIGLDSFPHIPEPPETKNTFRGNAEQKARFVHSYIGGVVVADDSGLEVLALDGRPGVFSKRYSEEGTAVANNHKLLMELSTKTDRRAQFRCVFAIFDGMETKFVEGTCLGKIALALSGSKGFGYDPLFVPDAHPNRSMAELSMTEKNEISHRGLALQELLKRKNELLT